jgi:YVTN family beta-propeller protein
MLSRVICARSAVGALLLLTAACGRRSKEPLVYVSNEDGGDVAVVDPNTLSVVALIPVGKRPRAVKLSRDGKLLYVALSGSPRAGPGVDESKLPPGDRSADGIGVVDLSRRALVHTYPSGQDPESFDLSLDGKTLYVSNEETAEMSVLDLASGVLLAKVPVGREPEGVTVRPDGKFVYVTSEGDAEVAAIDTATLTVTAEIPTGARPRSILFTKDGATAFVTDELAGSVTVVDVAQNKPTTTIKIEQESATPLGPRPMGAVLSKDGTRVYVSCGRAGSVAVIDVATRTQVRMLEGVGARPWGVGMSRDGKRLYTANGSSNDLSLVDVETGKIESRVTVGRLPWGVAVAE